MKQFIVIAHDAKDEGAYERRLATRDAHVAAMSKLRTQGSILIGVAIKNDADKMVGSVMVMNFPSRTELDAWLKTEPYVKANVWGEVTVMNGALGPSFSDLLKKAE